MEADAAEIVDAASLNDAAPRVCLDGPADGQAEVDAISVPSCAAWPSVDDLAGEVHVERSGTELSIDFGGGVVFVGTLIDGAVSLGYVHEHPWTDGCQWAATETLVGTMDAACSMSLSYDYAEEVVGPDVGCDAPCFGSSEVELDIVIPEVE